MDSFKAETYRPLLENDPPEFVDRVDTPWDQVPDLPEYNDVAYRRIVRDLERIRRDNARMREGTAHSAASSRGVLVLGEAGTGKTHLLMRVARRLSERNHILFVRKPNNEDAVVRVRSSDGRTGILSIWHIITKGDRGETKTTILPLAIDREAQRIPAWEKQVDQIYQLPPAANGSPAEDGILGETLEPMIQRELIHRGFISEQRGYDAKLIGWVEVVQNT